MSIDTSNHWSAFGIASAALPARKLRAVFATDAEASMLDAVLRTHEPPSLGLGQLKEPNLARVNYADGLRGAVGSLWRPLADHPAAYPALQLLGRLDSTWKAAEKRIGDEAQTRAAGIFAGRADQKTAIVEEEATTIATERGLAAAIRWLGVLKQECDAARQRLGQQTTLFSERKQRGLEKVEKLKTEWAELLGKGDTATVLIARRFLILAAAVLAMGYALWVAMIPVTSVIGIAAVATAVVAVMITARPILSRLHVARRTVHVATTLISAYRSASLASLDEMVKRQELEYPAALARLIGGLIERFDARRAVIGIRRQELAKRRVQLEASLFDAPATTRILLRRDAVQERYAQGLLKLSTPAWSRRLVNIGDDLAWSAFADEANAAFDFVGGLSAEAELYRLYPDRDSRMKMLASLRDAATESFVAIDLGAAAGQAPQVYLFIEIEDPATSELGKDIDREWSSAGIGIVFVPTSDPTEITFTAMLYGYRCNALRDWPKIESAFQAVKEREGYAIFPFLLGDEPQESQS